ncbi:response regulator [Croceiramulus getboli]|nr:response regulator [Flavobacteriaceae bacterium YJPT1-3]
MIRLPLIVLITFVSLSSLAQDLTTNPEGELEGNTVFLEDQLSALHDSTVVAYNSGRFSDSFKFNLRLLKQAQAMGHDRYAQIAYSGLGYDYLFQKDSIQARVHFEKARDLALKMEDEKLLAYSYSDLANLYLNTDKGKCISLFEKAIAIFNKRKDSTALSITYFNYLEALKEIEDTTHSMRVVDQLKALVPYMLKQGDTAFATAFRPLAALHYNQIKDYNKAQEILLPNLSFNFKKEQSIDQEYTYGEYSKALEGLGQYEEALNFFKKYDSIKDKNYELEKSKESAQLAAQLKLNQYQQDAKRQEIELNLQSQLVQNKSIINYLLAALCIVFLITLLHYYSTSQRRKKLVQKIKIQNEEYLQAKNESERLAKVKSNFFSTVSHELRTPLYGVIGMTSILLEDESLKNHRADLKSLKFSANYLLALINDVLQINKIDSNKIEKSNEVFNLRELLETLTLSFEYIRIQNNNTIQIEIAPEVPSYIQGNSVMLSQILMNLVGNATKFTEDGQITVKVSQDKREGKQAYLQFSVQDTGIGIAADKQESIFEEFSQGNATNYDYQGTGLGLPIVSRLLQLSGAEIHLESELGKGSNFYFTLPFEVAAKPEEGEQKHVSPLYTVDMLHGKRILIVDDNKINRTITQKILEKDLVHCHMARNGQEAVDMVRSHDYDLILMDVHMPVMDGLQATREIRTFDQATPVIALTAVEVEDMRSKIFDSGMNDIIVKPYDVQKFKRTIVQNFRPRAAYA